jgi:hypothetical protein
MKYGILWDIMGYYGSQWYFTVIPWKKALFFNYLNVKYKECDLKF